VNTFEPIDMQAREIPVAEWPAFLDQFSREHRAWLATVDRARPGSPGYTAAVERPLTSVEPHMAADRIARIEIHFGPGSQARDVIEIDAPASVRVDETADGVTRGLEIEDEEGECTRIRFRAAPLPEMLDGVAPGELPLPTPDASQ
jgi:hypothetical protein